MVLPTIPNPLGGPGPTVVLSPTVMVVVTVLTFSVFLVLGYGARRVLPIDRSVFVVGWLGLAAGLCAGAWVSFQ